MSFIGTARFSFIASGCVVLLCIPLIALSGRETWPERPIHVVQFIMTVVCLISSLLFWYQTRDRPSVPGRGLAVLAATLTFLWLLFIAFVYFALVRSGLSDV
jgi:predicted signal transduction protein with EAL and GGDEF domain